MIQSGFTQEVIYTVLRETVEGEKLSSFGKFVFSYIEKFCFQRMAIFSII